MAIGTGTAILGGAILGGALSSSGAKSAAKTQAKAADKATALQREVFETTREDQAPYREAGYAALDRLRELLGLGGNARAEGYGSLARTFSPGDLSNDPGYQFELAEGNRAINRAAGARGARLSGATLKALQKYGQGVASTKFDDAFNRNQVSTNTLFNRLSGVSGTGQTATDRVGQAGQIFANNASDNIIGAGNAAAASRLAQGNIFANTVNQGLAQWLRGQQGGGGYGPYLDPFFSGTGGSGD